MSITGEDGQTLYTQDELNQHLAGNKRGLKTEFQAQVDAGVAKDDRIVKLEGQMSELLTAIQDANEAYEGPDNRERGGLDGRISKAAPEAARRNLMQDAQDFTKSNTSEVEYIQLDDGSLVSVDELDDSEYQMLVEGIASGEFETGDLDEMQQRDGEQEGGHDYYQAQLSRESDAFNARIDMQQKKHAREIDSLRTEITDARTREQSQKERVYRTELENHARDAFQAAGCIDSEGALRLMRDNFRYEVDPETEKPAFYFVDNNDRLYNDINEAVAEFLPEYLRPPVGNGGGGSRGSSTLGGRTAAQITQLQETVERAKSEADRHTTDENLASYRVASKQLEKAQKATSSGPNPIH